MTYFMVHMTELFNHFQNLKVAQKKYSEWRNYCENILFFELLTQKILEVYISSKKNEYFV